MQNKDGGADTANAESLKWGFILSPFLLPCCFSWSGNPEVHSLKVMCAFCGYFYPCVDAEVSVNGLGICIFRDF